MVKVLENRVVDLDIMPGTKQAQERKKYVSAYYEAARRLEHERTGETDPLKIPDDSPINLSAAGNANASAQAVAGAVGGTVKGLVDTTGNTVGALGEGLYGTVTGLGKGLGSAGMYAGSAVGKGLGFGPGSKPAKTVEEKEEADKLEETKVDEGARRRSQNDENVKELEEFEQAEGIKMKD